MDEQTNPPAEPATTAPEPVTLPAGEANTPITETRPDNAPVEPPQTEPAQPQAELVLAPETPQIEPISEPIPTSPDTPTPQLPAIEALPETTPEPSPQGAVAPTLNHEDVVGHESEAPNVETPTPAPTPTSDANASEETPPQAEVSPQTQPQQGTAQLEPTPTPASAPAPLPAQAPTETPKNILMLLLTKARLVTELRKQKKLIKIMGLFAKKSHITNDDVEKLLHVSDATATRYLSELKRQGKISQTGKTGQAVSYKKI